MNPFARTRLDVPCTVEVEHSFDSLHAHAIPEGVDIRPGDIVLVHGAPDHVPPGTVATYACRATVLRAGWFARQWTQATALLEMAELWHVGFDPKESRP